MIITKETIAKLTKIEDWVSRGVCEVYSDRQGWKKWDVEFILDVGDENIEYFREEKKKTTRPMTHAEVMSIGHFVIKRSDGCVSANWPGWASDLGEMAKEYSESGVTYSDDGGNTWLPFTVEE